MTKHAQAIDRLERAVAAIKNAGGPDDLPFLAGPELTLVERLQAAIARHAQRLEPARVRRRRNRDAERDLERRERLGEELADRAATAHAYGLDDGRVVGLDLRDDEPVPFYLDAWEHEARGWSSR